MKQIKSAFPWDDQKHNIGDQGISQRLYIATKIACAKISSGHKSYLSTDKERVEGCYRFADELIKQDTK